MKKNTKTALKTKGMIKSHPTPPHSLHVKISRGKGHWNTEHISQSKRPCHTAAGFRQQIHCYKNPVCCVIHSSGLLAESQNGLG